MGHKGIVSSTAALSILLQRGIGDASRRVQRLAEEHENIGARTETLPEEEDSRKKTTSRLQSRKLRMADEVRDLESDLRRLAQDAKTEKAAADPNDVPSHPASG